jgi:hypothetical protein
VSKPWQSRPPRGKAVDHPFVRKLAAGPAPGTTPEVHRHEGRLFVHHRRTRLYLDRDAWEALRAPDDVLVQRIAPTGEPAFTIAITRAELERTFGEVRDTASWRTVRCYHFPKLPPAVEAYTVPAVPAAPTGGAGPTRRRGAGA